MTRKRAKSAHAEMARGAQHTEASGPQIEPRLDTEPIHFCGRRRSDATEFFDWQIIDEGQSHFRGDDKEAIGFVPIGGKSSLSRCPRRKRETASR